MTSPSLGWSWLWTTVTVVCFHVPGATAFVVPSAQGAVAKLQLSPRYARATSSSVRLAAVPNYIRWNTIPSSSDGSTTSTSDDQTWELQTAVTTFQRANPESGRRETVELHAQVHYGMESYFDYYNSPKLFADRHDHVLYELLVDQDLLQYHSPSKLWTLKEPLVASPSDRAVAQQYGWKCQVDVIQYHNPQQEKGDPPKWCHADWTRQELIQQNEKQRQHQETTSNNSPLLALQQDKGNNSNQQQRPLWQQVTTASAFWQPAMAALWVGPPSLLGNTASSSLNAATMPRNARKKLFTNLFLPGNSLAAWLRALLWLTVPAPEVSVLLLDWSSLWLTPTTSDSDSASRWGDRRREAPAKLSDVTIPMLQALMTLRFAELRQLVFGQVLVAGNSGGTFRNNDNNDNDWKLLVTQRNDQALQVLTTAFDQNGSKKGKSISLLYGCSHCLDLHTKLVRNFGFVPLKTEWRTAWSVTVPSTFGAHAAHDDSAALSTRVSLADLALPQAITASAQTALPQTALAALVVLLPLYCWLGAVDWVDTIQSSAVSLLEDHDRLAFGTEWAFYLLRHVLLYVGVSKFVLEWQDPNSKQAD